MLPNIVCRRPFFFHILVRLDFSSSRDFGTTVEKLRGGNFRAAKGNIWIVIRLYGSALRPWNSPDVQQNRMYSLTRMRGRGLTHTTIIPHSLPRLWKLYSDKFHFLRNQVASMSERNLVEDIRIVSLLSGYALILVCTLR